MPKINLLSKEVSELIAAGEVIDRPASVVKELVENSIDAGAAAVTVEIKNGGIEYIRITDNGCGIAPGDVPTAFLRHATSKVKSEADLNRIATLGFRGEALASVAAVAKVEMFTKVEDQPLGMRIRIEGGEQVLLEETGCQDGTTIIIRDLFYNIPARLKFLKKGVSEANVVTSTIHRVALSNPGVSMTLIRDNQKILQTPGDGKLYSAIYAIYGQAFAETLLPVSYDFGELGVQGYASIPMKARPNRSMQHFFVNGRYVKSRNCSLALDEGYKHSIMAGKFPACVLNITAPYDFVDVNVHPAKTEVRFVNERQVFDCLYFAVKSALAADDAVKRMQTAEAPPVAPPKKSPFQPDEGAQQVLHSSASVPDVTPDSLGHGSSGGYTYPERRAPETSKVAQPAAVYQTEREHAPPEPSEETYHFLRPEMLQPPVMEQPPALTPDLARSNGIEPEKTEEEPPIRLIGELFETYILAEAKNSLLLIDKHAAHERVLYEKLRTEQKTLDHQVLLSPFTVVLSPEECGAVLANSAVVDKLGFLVEDFGGSMLLVREIPALLDQHDASQLLAEVAINLKNNRHDPAPQILDDLYHSVACKAAVKAHDKNEPLELQALIERVWNDENIRYCPHGRPVVQVWSRSKINKLFGR